MLWRIRTSLPRQLLFLLAAAVLGGTAMYLFHCSPLLRFSPRMVTLGVVAGLIGTVLLAAATVVGLLLPKTGLRRSLVAARADLSRSSGATLLGAAVTGASGEEFLLRAILFGCLADDYLILAAALNAVVTGAAYYRGREHWYWTSLRILEGSWYAIVFFEHRSLTLLAAARLVQQTIASRALVSKQAEALLEQPRFSWRQLYEQGRTTRRIVRRV